MKLRFSVVLFASPESRVGVCGSIGALGSWKSHVVLSPIQIPRDPYHPSLWTGTVDIPEDLIETQTSFEYKFIKWTSTKLPDVNQTSRESGGVTLQFPPVAYSCETSIDFPETAVWEGQGGEENRIFTFKKEFRNSPTVHVFDRAHNTTPDGVYCLPVALFREGAVSEKSHTTRYYERMKSERDFHFNQIIDRIYVGSCPRSKTHIQKMKDELKITDVMNFQTLEDLVENYPDPEGNPDHSQRSFQVVHRLFSSFNMRYVAMPTSDMSTEARALAIPQAAFVLAALLQRPDCTGVYVHCNAGVGRSVACAAGFLHCCLGVPMRLTNLILCARRPVAFFDEVAVAEGANDFKKKFDAAMKLFKLPKFAPETSVAPAAKTAAASFERSASKESKSVDKPVNGASSIKI